MRPVGYLPLSGIRTAYLGISIPYSRYKTVEMSDGESLDRHRLRQVPGLIDVAATPDGDVVRQQLHRYRRHFYF